MAAIHISTPSRCSACKCSARHGALRSIRVGCRRAVPWSHRAHTDIGCELFLTVTGSTLPGTNGKCYRPPDPPTTSTFPGGRPAAVPVQASVAGALDEGDVERLLLAVADDHHGH